MGSNLQDHMSYKLHIHTNESDTITRESAFNVFSYIQYFLLGRGRLYILWSTKNISYRVQKTYLIEYKKHNIFGYLKRILIVQRTYVIVYRRHILYGTKDIFIGRKRHI